MTDQLFPNEKIIITEYFDVHQDWAVPIPGFFIIASRKGRVSLNEFADNEASEFFALLRKLRKGMKDVLGIENVCLFQDEATHHRLFHLWIFPRYPWMDEFGTRIESIRPAIEHAKQNMVNEKALREVKDMVKTMGEYMRNFPS
ncbi:MAG: diadenosine tetraphosphate hydrolase [Candidatus Pacebacteria bacterium]|nr:diadenosine tetraphosphate hydrolase [Candidatus Paceibacterota bacterium]